jgi:eukaryotic-like serine/threonine-protein kinase
LLDPVGSGATATVWRAWDPRRRELVAARVLHRAPAAGQSAVPAATTTVSHPHVATTVRLDDHEVLPLVRGGSAEVLLAEHGALPASFVAVLLDQLLSALAAVHAAGLVHRDVKPANLLLHPTGSDRPHLLLGDFGAAVPVGAAVPPTGTPGYLAADAWAGAPPAPRHDLYAAGMTAVELLTGRLPRGGRDLPRGPLRSLLAELTTDATEGPPGAVTARRRLHEMGVPSGTPWRHGPRPPFVPDRLPAPTLGRRLIARRVPGRAQGVSAAP